MGAPAFAVPALQAIARTGSNIVAVLTKPPQQAGRRGLELTGRLCISRPRRWASPSKHRRRYAIPRFYRRLGRLAGRSGGGGGLRAAPAAGGARRAAAWLLQSACIAAAALARRGAGAASDHGRRRGDRRFDHADGGRTRHRPDCGELRTPIGDLETSAELTARLAELAAQTIFENWNALVDDRLAFAAQSLGRRRIRAQDRQVRSPDRLERPRPPCATTHPRLVAVSRRDGDDFGRRG